MKNKVKTLFTALLVAVLVFSMTAPAFADAISVPENSFRPEDRSEIKVHRKHYHFNGKNGYVAVYETPLDKEPCRYIPNGGIFESIEIWKGEWVLLAYDSDSLGATRDIWHTDTASWAHIDDLRAIYTKAMFHSEHILEKTELSIDAKGVSVAFYDYPCSYGRRSMKVNEQSLRADYSYVDGEGRTWLHIKNVTIDGRTYWVCRDSLSNMGIRYLNYYDDLVPPTDVSQLPQVFEGTQPAENLPVDRILLYIIACAAAVAIAAICVVKKMKKGRSK